MKKKILFISYDGLSDPLGLSQILPYLIGLANKGHEIQVISAEKEKHFEQQEVYIREKIKGLTIHWGYTHYANRPPFISTYLLMKRMRKLAHAYFAINQFDIVHCRSLIPAMIGFSLKKQYGCKLIFDIRGFWADERVEGGLWDLKNPVYRWLFHYFKKKEKRLFESADGIVSLTEKAKKYIIDFYRTKAQFAVIPCSADINHFNRQGVSTADKNALRAKLGLEADDYVLVYVGSLGTRYLLKEMMLFFKALKSQNKQAKMLFLSQSPANSILQEANKLGIDQGDLVINAVSHQEIPDYINVADAGIFFIHEGFTGKAVSPTKQSELLALGLPVVTNSGIGDSEEIIENNDLGVVLKNFEANSISAAVKQLLQSDYDKNEIRQKAKTLFALEVAVDKYDHLYGAL